MAEPVFGTVSPIWSAVPFPGVAWFQAPMTGTGPIGATAGIAGPQGQPAFGSGMTTSAQASRPLAGEPYAFARGIPPQGPVTGFGGGSPSYAPAPTGSAFSPWGPPMGGPEMTVGITAPVLVSAIAQRRGQPAGPTSDQEFEDFIYDALDLLPGSSEVEVRCDGGRISLMGAVSRSDSNATSARLPGPSRASTTCRTTSRSRRDDELGRRVVRQKHRLLRDGRQPEDNSVPRFYV